MTPLSRPDPNAPPTTHGQLRAAVRRFKRETLLRGLGILTAAEWDRSHGRHDEIGHPLPWATSLIAREALLSPSASGAKHPPATPTQHDVDVLAEMAADLALPPLDGADAEQSLHDFSVRTAYQQWPYSTSSAFGNLARLRPMFERTFPTDRFEVLSAETLSAVLGAPLDVFVDSAPFFGAAASVNNGQFDEAWLSGPQFDEVRAEIDLDQLLSVFRTAWSADLNELRREAQKAAVSPVDTMRQFDWNPLLARPFVRMSSGDYVAPQVRWAHLRINPTAIYHLGYARHKEAWAHDLGKAQEDYIVLQLEQLQPTAVVVPEIEWKTKQGLVRSVDAIVVFDDCTVLIESKSLRARLDSTTDFATYADRLSREDLFKALDKQVPRTLDAIRSGHPAFSAIPSDDRPILALIVTPEPLYLANVPAQRKRLPDPGIPYAMISLTELEHIVAAALADGSGATFQAVVAPHHNGSISPNDAMKTRFANERPDNPLLNVSWAKTRWTKPTNI